MVLIDTVLLTSNAAKLTATLVSPTKSAALAEIPAVLTYTVDAVSVPALAALRVIVKSILPPSVTALAAFAVLEATA